MEFLHERFIIWFLRSKFMGRHSVVGILGKRNSHGKYLTVECKDRVDHLVDLIRKEEIRPDSVVFSGGRSGSKCMFSEAGLMKDYFEGQVDFPSDRIYVDTEARDTRENIANIAGYIRRMGIPGEEIDFALCSSDYHLRRIEKVDNSVRAESCLVPAYELGIKNIRYLPAPYTFRDSKDPLQRLQANLYEVGHDLTVTQILMKHAGLHEGAGIPPDAAQEFQAGLLRISENLHFDRLTPEEQRVEYVGLQALALLSPWNLFLSTLSRQPALNQDNRNVLGGGVQLFDHAVKLLKGLDPDEAA